MRSSWRWSALTLVVLLVCSASARGQGIILSAAGPVHRSMGGASTAAPMEAIGAIYWNPATTSALQNELGFGMDLLLPVLKTSSSVAGLGGGASQAEPGVSALPAVGWIYRPAESNLTFGLGLLPLGGLKTNYGTSTTNPFFLPQANAPNTPGGFGRVYTEASFLQMAPTIAMSVTDKLSVGIGPTLTLGQVIVDPLVPATPDDADGSTVPRYPSGRGTRVHWGGGAQLGVYYIADNCWHWGASIKSPQWMEDFRYHTEDELGRPRVARHNLDLPMIISVGTAYTGHENVTVAVDVRYFDYRNTNELGDAGFSPQGALLGIDQSNIFAVAAGAQFKMNDDLYMRMGYTFNQSPMQDSDAAIGVFAPLYYQHQIGLGASRRLADNVWVNMSYAYYPDSKLAGPIITPAGPVPGSKVITTVSAHDLGMGVTVRY